MVAIQQGQVSKQGQGQTSGPPLQAVKPQSAPALTLLAIKSHWLPRSGQCGCTRVAGRSN